MDGRQTQSDVTSDTPTPSEPLTWVGVLRNDGVQFFYSTNKEDPVEYVDGVVIVNGKESLVMFPLSTIKNVVMGETVALVQTLITQLTSMYSGCIPSNVGNYWIPECPQPGEPCQVNS